MSIIQWILWRNRRMGLWTLWPATPGKTGADRSRPDAKEDFCEENRDAAEIENGNLLKMLLRLDDLLNKSVKN